MSSRRCGRCRRGGGDEMNALLLEAPLQAPREFVLHIPAALDGAADLAGDGDAAAVELVDAPQLEVAEDRVVKFWLAPHLGGDRTQALADPVGVLLEGH